MEYSLLLQTLGLTSNEAQIYEVLLQTGQVQAHVLIAKSGLKRATVYKSLYTLEAKGLVKQTDIAKKLHFAPNSPQTLLELSERQFEKQQRTRDDLRNILPLLTSNYIMSTEKPDVTTYEGVEGLKKIYEDTLKENQPIYATVQKSDIDPVMLTWLDDVYRKKRAKAGIFAHVIIASGGLAEQFISTDKDYCRETRLVDSKLYPFQHEINIYGSKVAFIDWRKDSKLIGMVINHQNTAISMKALFDLAWNYASKISDK